MAGNANSGRRNTEKHFLEALKMQLASAGKDHKALRAVASALDREGSERRYHGHFHHSRSPRWQGASGRCGDDDLDPIRVVQRLERVIVDADKAGIIAYLLASELTIPLTYVRTSANNWSSKTGDNK
jgi:hypothetical protein